jgi:hypothetical protein
MIMIVYKSLYALGMYNEEKKLLETSWTNESNNLDVIAAKKEFLLMLKAIEQSKPSFILADTCNFTMEMDHDFQNWIVLKFISGIMEMKVSKYAILVTPEKFENVSNEVMEDFPDEDFEIQYFIDKSKALNWLSVK